MEKIKLASYCKNRIDSVSTNDDYDIDYIDISSVDNVMKKVTGYTTYNISEAPSRAKQLLKKFDVLVSTVRPNLNAVAVCDIETENVLVGSTGFCVLRGNEKANSKFLFYFCQSDSFVGQLMKVATGASYPAVSKNDVKNVLVPKYHLVKQNEIVETLDKISGIISHRKEQLKLLDDLIKSRFVEMFGDPILNNKEWNLHQWKEVLVIKNGRNQKKVENENGEYPICGSGGIMGYADDYICGSNSVIIGRKGNINKPILMKSKFWNVDTAFGLEPNKGVLDVNYLYMFCDIYNFEKHNKAVTIPSLTKGDLQEIKMPLPPIQLQDKYAEFVDQVDKLKVEVQKTLEQTQILFDSLMQEYFE